jgi:hypothetical protein
MQAQVEIQGAAPGPSGMPPDPLDGLLKQMKLKARPEFENNDLHLERHNSFRKTKQYRDLPEWAQALVDRHCMDHLPPPPPAPMGGPGGPPGGPPGMDGQPPPGGADPSSAEQQGDIGAGLPPMPKTPTPANGLKVS